MLRLKVDYPAKKTNKIMIIVSLATASWVILMTAFLNTYLVVKEVRKINKEK